MPGVELSDTQLQLPAGVAIEFISDCSTLDEFIAAAQARPAQHLEAIRQKLPDGVRNETVLPPLGSQIIQEHFSRPKLHGRTLTLGAWVVHGQFGGLCFREEAP